MDYLVAGLFHPILFLNALKLLRKMKGLMGNDDYIASLRLCIGLRNKVVLQTFSNYGD